MNTKTITSKQLEQLHQQIGKLPDCRQPRGIRHRYCTVLTLALAGVVCGCRSLIALGEFAASLTRSQLKRVGARFNKTTHRHQPPSVAWQPIKDRHFVCWVCAANPHRLRFNNLKVTRPAHTNKERSVLNPSRDTFTPLKATLFRPLTPLFQTVGSGSSCFKPHFPDHMLSPTHIQLYHYSSREVGGTRLCRSLAHTPGLRQSDGEFLVISFL